MCKFSISAPCNTEDNVRCAVPFFICFRASYFGCVQPQPLLSISDIHRRKLSWELPTWSVNVMCRPNSESLITTHLFLIRHERNPTDFNYRYYPNISEVDALSRNHQLSLYISCGPPTLCITKLQHRAPEPRSQCLELVRTDSRRASHTSSLFLPLGRFLPQT